MYREQLPVLAFFATTALLTSVPSASALDIVLNYRAGKSDPPRVDPTGSGLQTVMEEAAAVWERLFPGVDETFTINYYWKDIDSPFLGIGGDDDAVLARTSNALFSGPRTKRVRFDTHSDRGREVRWWIDATPEDDDEFHMWSEYFSAGGSAGYVGLLGEWPSWVETSRVGVMDGYEDMSRSWDLFTTALHEIGHALGFGFERNGELESSGSILVDRQWLARFVGDEVYSVLPPRIPAGIETDSDGIDHAHLMARTLMDEGLPPFTRYRPSILDVITIAWVNEWDPTGATRPRLERMEMAVTRNDDGSVFSPSLSWSIGDHTNWLGERAPSEQTHAFIRAEEIEQVTLDSNVSTGSLEIDHLDTSLWTDGVGITLNTGPNRLRVLDELSVRSGPGGRHLVRVEIDGRLRTGTADFLDAMLTLEPASRFVSGGQVRFRLASQLTAIGTADEPVVIDMPDGPMFFSYGSSGWVWRTEVAAYALTLDSDSELLGGNTVFSELWSLSNDGRIVANNGDLEFRDRAGGVFDLDGWFENGVWDARDGSIYIDGTALDAFDGEMEIGQRLAFGKPWELGEDGVVRMYAPYAEFAVLAAPDTRVYGLVEVLSDAAAVIASQLTVEAEGRILIHERAALAFSEQTTFRGGEVWGLGTLYQAGRVVVEEDQTIEVPIYVWDGDGTTTPEPFTVVRAGRTFTLDVDSIGDGYDGDLTLEEGSELVVNLPGGWMLNGVARLDNAQISGDPFLNRGRIEGSGVIHAPVTSDGTIAGPTGPGEVLHLAGGYTALPGAVVTGNVTW